MAGNLRALAVRMLAFFGLTGHDIFISYKRGPHPRGESLFASTLAEELRRRRFRVFLDVDEPTAGDVLPRALTHALTLSRALVLVATPESLRAPWVASEIEIFLGFAGRDVIPLDVDGAYSTLDAGQALPGVARLKREDRVWLDVSGDDVAAGRVPRALLDKLSARFTFRKRQNVMIGSLSIVALMLAAITLVALVSRQEAAAARDEARETAAKLAQSNVELRASEKLAKAEQDRAEKAAQLAREQARIATTRGTELEGREMAVTSLLPENAGPAAIARAITAFRLHDSHRTREALFEVAYQHRQLSKTYLVRAAALAEQDAFLTGNSRYLYWQARQQDAEGGTRPPSPQREFSFLDVAGEPGPVRRMTLQGDPRLLALRGSDDLLAVERKSTSSLVGSWTLARISLDRRITIWRQALTDTSIPILSADGARIYTVQAGAPASLRTIDAASGKTVKLTPVPEAVDKLLDAAETGPDRLVVQFFGPPRRPGEPRRGPDIGIGDWNLRTGEFRLLDKLGEGPARLYGRGEGAMALVGHSEKQRVFSMENGRVRQICEGLPALEARNGAPLPPSTVRAIAGRGYRFSRNGATVMAVDPDWGRAHVCHRIRTASEYVVGELPRISPPVTAVALSADGTRIALSTNDRLTVHALDSGETFESPIGVSMPVHRAVFTEQGRLLTWSLDGTLIRWQETGRPAAHLGEPVYRHTLDPATPEVPDMPVLDLAFSKDSAWLASLSFRGESIVAPVRPGAASKAVRGSLGRDVLSIALVQGRGAEPQVIPGVRRKGASDAPVRLKTADACNPGGAPRVESLRTIAPGGSALVLVADEDAIDYKRVLPISGLIRMVEQRWDDRGLVAYPTYVFQPELPVHRKHPLSLCVRNSADKALGLIRGLGPFGATASADLEIVAGGNGKNEIELWRRTSTGFALARTLPKVHSSQVQALAMSEDRRWLASGDNEGDVALWNLGSGRHWLLPTTSPERKPGPAVMLRFDPAGRFLASAHRDASVRLWSLDPEDVLREACAMLRGGRYLRGAGRVDSALQDAVTSACASAAAPRAATR